LTTRRPDRARHRQQPLAGREPPNRVQERPITSRTVGIQIQIA
jgi:hypothetical protein